MGDPVTIGLMVGSTVLSAASSIQQGKAQQQLMNYQAQQAQNIANAQAQQLEYQAGQERAASQQRLIAENRTKRLAMSRAQALAAASGGGSLDPSVINIMGDLETQGEYNKGTIMYEGEEAAKGNEYQAAVTRSQGNAQAAIDRFSGKMYRQAGFMEATNTIMKGGSSLYNKYAEGSGGLYGGGYSDTSAGRINWYPSSYR